MGTPRSRVTSLFRWTVAPSLAALLFACSEKEPGCRIRVEGDGTRVLLCDDGSRMELDVLPPPVRASGTLRGEARLFGRASHDEITASIHQAGGGYSTSTRVGVDGTWELELPAGIYEVEYFAVGYESQRLKQIVVATGDATLPRIELRAGAPIHPESPTRILMAPDERGLLLFFGEPGGLWWWSPTQDARQLSGFAASVSFTPSGDRIVFLDNFDQIRSAGTLVLLDPAGGKPIRVADDVQTWAMSPDEGVIAAQQTSSRLVVWKAGEGSAVVTDGLDGWSFAPSGRTVIFRTRVPGGAFRVIHWDVPAAGGSGLEAPWQAFDYSPGGESFLYANMAGETVLWDGLRNHPILLGARGSGRPLFGPDGQWLLFPGIDGWRLLDLSAPAPIPIDGTIDHALFSEDGTALFHGVDSMGGASLSRRDLRTGQTVELARGRSITGPSFAGPATDRWLIFSIRPESFGKQRLLGWNADAGLVTLSERVDGTWTISPDGQAVAFLEDERLVVASLSAGTRSASAEPASATFAPQWTGSSAVLFLSREGNSRFTIFDPARSITVSLGDWVDWRSCSAAPDGSTSCLARPSMRQGGSKLVRWDSGTGVVTEITDGVLEFTQSFTGGRLALRTRALPSTRDDLLFLFDPSLGEPIAIADLVRQPVVASDWMAWISLDLVFPGAWQTAYPAEFSP